MNLWKLVSTLTIIVLLFTSLASTFQEDETQGSKVAPEAEVEFPVPQKEWFTRGSQIENLDVTSTTHGTPSDLNAIGGGYSSLPKSAVLTATMSDHTASGTITSTTITVRYGGESGIGGTQLIEGWDSANEVAFCTKECSSSSEWVSVTLDCPNVDTWTEVDNLQVKITNKDDKKPQKAYIDFIDVNVNYVSTTPTLNVVLDKPDDGSSYEKGAQFVMNGTVTCPSGYSCGNVTAYAQYYESGVWYDLGSSGTTFTSTDSNPRNLGELGGSGESQWLTPNASVVYQRQVSKSGISYEGVESPSSVTIGYKILGGGGSGTENLDVANTTHGTPLDLNAIGGGYVSLPKSAVLTATMSDHTANGTITSTTITVRYSGESGIGGTQIIQGWDSVNNVAFCTKEYSSSSEWVNVTLDCPDVDTWTEVDNLQVKVTNKDDKKPQKAYIDSIDVNVNYASGTSTTSRDYIKLDISGLPDDVTINEAGLYFYVNTPGGATDVYYAENYDSSTSNQAVYENTIGQQATGIDTSSTGWKTGDVKSAVQNAADNKKDFIGFQLRETGEDAWFAIDGTGTNAPTLAINYATTNPTQATVTWNVKGNTIGEYMLRIHADTTCPEVNPSNSSAHSVNIICTSCPSGDITGTKYVSDMVCIVANDITVKNGGNLTLDNVTLKIDSSYEGEYGIKVESGGAMYIKSGSIITANNPSYNFFFQVLDGAADFDFVDSCLSECGYAASGYTNDGLYIEADNVVNITNVTITNCADGIIIIGGDNNVFADNEVYSNERFGIYSKESTNNTFTGNKMYDNGQNNFWIRSGHSGITYWGNVSHYDHYVDTSNLVEGLPVYYYFSESDIILDSAINPTKHITLANCTNMTVKNVNMSGGDGVFLRFTSNSEVYNVTMKGKYVEYGISMFQYSSHNKIHDNNISLNRYLIYAQDGSDYNEIYNNVLGDTTGVAIESRWTNHTWIHNNTIKNISYGSNIEFGIWLRHAHHCRVENNYVEGLPTSKTTCTGEGINAIDLSHVINVTVKNNTFVNSDYGLHIDWMYNSTIVDNNASGNGCHGMYNWASGDSERNNIITNNTFDNNGYGIYFKADNAYAGDEFDPIHQACKYNTVTGNYVRNNRVYGIYLADSSSYEHTKDNKVYDNYIADNINDDARDVSGLNYWNTAKDCSKTSITGGNCIGGNYYSDYTGIDSDGDGIGDTSYSIPGGSSVDHLPLVIPAD